MHHGWIKLHRKIRNNDIFNDLQLLRLWMICLTEASHKAHELLVGKQVAKLHPGEFVTGRFDLHEMYNSGLKKKDRVSEITVWRWLKTLENGGFLNIKVNNKFSVVSILNWDIYQSNEQQIDQQMNNKRSTNEQQMITNKNGKEIKNEKNIDEYAHAVGESDGVPLTGHEGDRPLTEGGGEISHTPSMELENRFIQLRGKGLGLSALDYQAIDQVIDSGIPLEDALHFTKECFEQYQPRFPGDTISSFKYCAKYILGRYSKIQAENQQSVKTPSKSDYLDALNKWISEGGIPSEFPGI